MSYIKFSVLTVALLCASTAFAQPGPRGPAGGRGPGGGGKLMLLSIPEVREEVSLSDEQGQQLLQLGEEMRNSFNPQIFAELQSLSGEDRKKKMDEIREKAEEMGKQADEKVAKILDTKQMDRLKQLQVQRAGGMALNMPEVAKELNLTEEQKNSVKKITEGLTAPDFQAVQKMSDEERQKFFGELRTKGEKAQTDLVAVLTPEQKTKFTAMKGKEFKFPEMGPGGPGGPGGGRRRPRGNDDNN